MATGACAALGFVSSVAVVMGRPLTGQISFLPFLLEKQLPNEVGGSWLLGYDASKLHFTLMMEYVLRYNTLLWCVLRHSACL